MPTLKTTILTILTLSLLTPAIALAHQPKITENSETNVSDPEISKAFYGQLNGEPHTYTISSDKDFNLYVNILVPAIPKQEKDVSAEILKDGNTINTLSIIPELKRNFFNESPISLIKSPIGWGYILIMYVIAFIFGFLYRLILRKLASKTVQKVHHNIGTRDRTIRLIISLALLIWAITTSWNPLLLFFAGFTLFEAIFSWCGLYAALGKSSCPL